MHTPKLPFLYLPRGLFYLRISVTSSESKEVEDMDKSSLIEREESSLFDMEKS